MGCVKAKPTVAGTPYPRQGYVPVQPGYRTNPMTGYPQSQPVVVQQSNNSDQMVEGMVIGAAVGYGAATMMHDGGMYGAYGMGAMMPTCDVSVGPIDVI